MNTCLWVLNENSKFDSYSVRNSVLSISYFIVHTFPSTFLEIAVYIWQKRNLRIWNKTFITFVSD